MALLLWLAGLVFFCLAALLAWLLFRGGVKQERELLDVYITAV